MQPPSTIDGRRIRLTFFPDIQSRDQIVGALGFVPAAANLFVFRGNAIRKLVLVQYSYLFLISKARLKFLLCSTVFAANSKSQTAILALLMRALAQTDPRAAAIFVDEFDAGGF